MLIGSQHYPGAHDLERSTWEKSLGSDDSRMLSYEEFLNVMFLIQLY